MECANFGSDAEENERKIQEQTEEIKKNNNVEKNNNLETKVSLTQEIVQLENKSFDQKENESDNQFHEKEEAAEDFSTGAILKKNNIANLADAQVKNLMLENGTKTLEEKGYFF